MSTKLKVKDLVLIGVFFLIYYALMWIVGLMCIIPILFLCFPAALGIAAGPTSMLFMAKVPKRWALFIFGILPHLLNVAMGYHPILLLIALVFIGIAEFINQKSGFKSFKYSAISYALIPASMSVATMQILIVRDYYKEICNRMGEIGPDFFAKFDAIISWPVVGLVIIGGFLGGIIGAFIGKLMLKKHFEKAGIV
ncbi:MAG: hypothetical protein CR988_05930 [Treponema sp.]|nr:MAG: hypothetical protein CR988_05930 [Treponema sp.]